MIDFFRKRPFLSGMLIAAAILVTGMSVRHWGAGQSSTDPPPYTPIIRSFDEIVPGRKTLIIAPHPDDEVLAAGGLIFELKRLGREVKIVFVTNGDGYRGAVIKNFGILTPKPRDFLWLGRVRAGEALEAVQTLGVPKEDVVFLGFPDAGISRLWDNNWEAGEPYRGINGAQSAPYPFVLEPDAPYTGLALLQNLTRILREFQPTEVVFPDSLDSNGDHQTLHWFTKLALTQTRFRGSQWTYLVHQQGFPVPDRFSPDLYLTPPPWSRDPAHRWHILKLDKRSETAKEDALKKHQTQLAMRFDYLNSFIRKNELFAQIQNPVLSIQPDSSQEMSAPFVGEHLIWESRTEAPKPEGQAVIAAVGGVMDPNRLTVLIATQTPLTPEQDLNLEVKLVYPSEITRYQTELNQASAGHPTDSGAVASLLPDHIWAVCFPIRDPEQAAGLFIEVQSRSQGRLAQTVRQFMAILHENSAVGSE